MLRSIPGYSHLKTLRTPKIAATTRKGHRLPPNDAVRAIIRIALDVAYGMRPLSALQRARYDSRVRIHLSAFLKSSSLRGPVHVQRIDFHPAPVTHDPDPLALQVSEALDVVGHCQVGGTTKAFAARVELPEGKRHWVMRTLRVN